MSLRCAPLTIALLAAAPAGALRPAWGRDAEWARAAARPGEARFEKQATRPRTEPAAFAPGVTIDWARRTARVEAEVVLSAGPLEFFACFRGREHESILRLNAAATHVYMALGLVGVAPGRPPAWNERTGRFDPPTGDLVDVSIEWEQDGALRTVDAFDWLRDARTGGPVVARPWVFAGSLRRPDGMLEADASGRGVGLVDFPDNLLSLSRNHVSDDAELWAEAAETVIPPRGTKVVVVLKAARLRPHAALLDFRGELQLDDRPVGVADFADVLMLNRRIEPQYVQAVVVRGALRSDVARLRRGLESLGVPPRAVEFLADAATRPSATR